MEQNAVIPEAEGRAQWCLCKEGAGQAQRSVHGAGMLGYVCIRKSSRYGRRCNNRVEKNPPETQRAEPTNARTSLCDTMALFNTTIGHC